MKIAKILLLFLTFIIVSASALAYSVSISWTMNQPNYEVELYPCSNSVCNSVGSRILYDITSGYTYNMYYIASGNAYHAVYFYKPGYRPIGYTLSSWGDWSTSFSSSFTKKDYCESTIGTLSVSDSTPTIGETIIITAPVSSAFTASDDHSQSPRYYPSSHIDYFTSDIDASLKVYDSDGILVMTLPSQTKNIYQDDIQSVSFNLDTTSLSLGDYRIVLSTNPIESICDQNNKLIRSKELWITVDPVIIINTPPIISGILDLSFLEDSGLQNNIIDLWSYTSDAETPLELTFTIISESNPAVVDCNIDSNQYIDCTAQTNQNGYSDVIVEVKDPEGLTDTDTFRVTVTPVNDAPVVIGVGVQDQTVDSCHQFATFDLDDIVSDVDDNDAELTWAVTGNTRLVIVIDSTTHMVTITYPPSFTGSETLTFTATDPEGLTDSDTATFTVTQCTTPNNPPVISDIPGQTIDSCHQFATFDLDDIVSDVDDNDAELTWAVTGNTRLVIVIDSTTHMVTITYPPSFTGSETLTFTATDPEGLTDSDTATFTITACASNNTAPELSNIPDKGLEEDSGENDKIRDLWDYASDDESSDSELDFSITEQTNTNLVTCSISSDRYVDCKVKDGKTGVSYVTVEVKDPQGLTDTDTFKVTVEKASSSSSGSGDEKGLTIMSVSYDDKVKAGDYMHISIDVKGLEDGIITTVRIDDIDIYETFNKISGIYVLIPEDTKLGVYDFQISVKNDDGYRDSVYRSLEVISKTSEPNARIANENENDEQITGASVVVTETASGNTASEGQTSFNLEGILGLVIGLIFLLIVLGVLAIFYVFRNGKGNKKTGLAKNVYCDSTKISQQPTEVPPAMPLRTFHGAEETEKFIYGSQQPSSDRFFKKT